jgi:hypothetical protein
LTDSLGCSGRTSHQHHSGSNSSERCSPTTRLNPTVNRCDVRWLLIGQPFVQGGRELLVGPAVAGTCRPKNDGRSHDIALLGIGPKTLGPVPFSEGIDEGR